MCSMSLSVLFFTEKRARNPLFSFEIERITEIASGNKKALERVYNEYGRMILSVAYQITGDVGEAEDVLQDTMIRILRLSHTYKKGTNPKAWVLKVTKNSAVDKIKEKKHTLSLEEISEKEKAQSAFEPQTLEQIMLRDALNTLSDEEKLIVKLRIYAGLSHSEIANVIEKNTVSVRKKYQRALEKLKNYCEGGR